MNANYAELCMLMSSDLVDHTHLRNKDRQYFLEKVKYMNYLRDDGRRLKLTDTLCCMWQVHQQENCLQHSFGAVRIFTDAKFFQAFLNIPGPFS